MVFYLMIAPYTNRSYPFTQINSVRQQRHRAGNVRRVACERKETARINRTRQHRHDVTQPAEARIGNMVFVQIRSVRLPKRRGMSPLVMRPNLLIAS